MLKLLICMLAGLAISVTVLQLRQQRLELNYQINRLHNQIESQQAKLWDQQLQIAMYTAPNSITQTVNTHELKLVPRSPLPAETANWLDVGNDPDAE